MSSPPGAGPGAGQPSSGPGSPSQTPVPSPRQVAEQTTEQLLASILQTLQGVFAPGVSTPNFVLIKITTGGTFQKLVSQSTIIKQGFLQNLSTDTASVFNASTTQYMAVNLNPAGAANQAGGSTPFGNIDLQYIWVTAATTGDYLMLYYEQ